jgi:transcriptional regulator with XRE-family HTH domain
MESMVGMNIRWQREQRAWTQEHLAAVAEVDVRTIQRAEAGELIAADTQQAIAAAFDITVAEMHLGPKPLAEARERFKLIRLHKVERGVDLRDDVPTDACNFAAPGVVDKAQEDAAAEFERDLADVNDVWNGLDAVTRLDLLRSLDAPLAALTALGLVVAVATEPIRMRSERLAPFTMNVLYVVVSKASEPKLFAVRDRTAPVQFQ